MYMQASTSDTRVTLESHVNRCLSKAVFSLISSHLNLCILYILCMDVQYVY